VGGLGLDDPSYLLRTYKPRGDRQLLSPTAPQSTFGPADYSGKSRFESPATGSLEAARKIRSLPDRVGELSRAEISAEAKRILGPRRGHDSLAADKFSQHLRAGEDYLRAGKYYRAANSFALASVYRADDPRALAGRSHALFAAGEYISSALFLSRALAIRPEHVKVRVDFVTLLGGPNRLAGRIADIEQWFARSGSGQLQLLLGYVYYQTGRLNEAKRAIDAARTKMPESSAFSAITTAINDASIGR
jgi:tetratricopeptide (TPR) repeat protein